MSTTVAAVDLGATSGRVMLGHIGRDELRLEPVSRFDNRPVRTRDGLHWNILELYRDMCSGLSNAAARAPLTSVAIDSWAVDYALLRAGRMLASPLHYRDGRNHAASESVHRRVDPAELYRINGLQHLPFNTVFQLAADAESGLVDAADTLLLIPDLFGYWLTGRQVAERTNASTTGLLDATTGEWSTALLQRLGHSPELLPELVDAGAHIGPFTGAVAEQLGTEPISVTAVGSHDTASAVVAVPAEHDSFAYISCGTWSLIGVELDSPVLSEEGRAANFTNERGVDGRIRYLHNVMGLWLLNESLDTWGRDDPSVSLDELLAAAAEVPEGSVSVFDPNDTRFLPPGDVPSRITTWLIEHDQPVPRSRAEFVRSIMESLAMAYTESLHTVEQLTGQDVSTVHIVGGGAHNTLLCQLTADRTGREVIAGPVEATALGNVLVQSRSVGALSGTIEALRAHVRRVYAPQRYLPRPTR